MLRTLRALHRSPRVRPRGSTRQGDGNRPGCRGCSEKGLRCRIRCTVEAHMLQGPVHGRRRPCPGDGQVAGDPCRFVLLHRCRRSDRFLRVARTDRVPGAEGQGCQRQGHRRLSVADARGQEDPRGLHPHGGRPGHPCPRDTHLAHGRDQGGWCHGRRLGQGQRGCRTQGRGGHTGHGVRGGRDRSNRRATACI